MSILIYINFDKPFGENVKVERVIPPAIPTALSNEDAQIADVILEYDDYAGKGRLLKYPVPTLVDQPVVVELAEGVFYESKRSYKLGDIGKNAATRMIQDREEDDERR